MQNYDIIKKIFEKRLDVCFDIKKYKSIIINKLAQNPGN